MTPGEMARNALALLHDDSVKAAFAKTDPTAVRTLLAAAQQVGSVEELELVMRYQQSRLGRDHWDEAVVKKLLELVRKAADGEDVAGRPKPEAERQQAEAAARQLALVARAHRVAYEARRGAEDPKGDGRVGKDGRR